MFGTWRAMEDAYRDGKLRAIGVSNFQSARFFDFTLTDDDMVQIATMNQHDTGTVNFGDINKQLTIWKTPKTKQLSI